MIKRSTTYALVQDGVVIEKGPLSELQTKKRQLDKLNQNHFYEIYQSPSSDVGSEFPVSIQRRKWIESNH